MSSFDDALIMQETKKLIADFDKAINKVQGNNGVVESSVSAAISMCAISWCIQMQRTLAVPIDVSLATFCKAIRDGIDIYKKEVMDK